MDEFYDDSECGCSNGCRNCKDWSDDDDLVKKRIDALSKSDITDYFDDYLNAHHQEGINKFYAYLEDLIRYDIENYGV